MISPVRAYDINIRGRSRSGLALFATLCAGLALAGCGRTPQLDVRTATPVKPVEQFQAVQPPAVIAVDPPNGATDVDPSRTTLSATFDRPMDPEGWAWVIEHPSTAPDLGDSTWDAAVRTNTAKVRLEPGRSYVIWLNSPQYTYFKDRQGIAAAPYRWTFTTRKPR